MIEAAAALPRKFGYNWWNEDKCNTDEEKNNVCKDFFSQIDENGDGSVSFEEWLEFAMKHFQEKCRSELPVAFDALDKESFIMACKSPGIDVYWFMWKSFQAADVDRDGLVDATEFEKMIVTATAPIQR